MVQLAQRVLVDCPSMSIDALRVRYQQATGDYIMHRVFREWVRRHGVVVI